MFRAKAFPGAQTTTVFTPKEIMFPINFVFFDRLYSVLLNGYYLNLYKMFKYFILSFET